VSDYRNFFLLGSITKCAEEPEFLLERELARGKPQIRVFDQELEYVPESQLSILAIVEIPSFEPFHGVQ